MYLVQKDLGLGIFSSDSAVQDKWVSQTNAITFDTETQRVAEPIQKEAQVRSEHEEHKSHTSEFFHCCLVESIKQSKRTKWVHTVLKILSY